MNKALGELAKRKLVGKVQNAKCEYFPLLPSFRYALGSLEEVTRGTKELIRVQTRGTG